MGRLKDSIEEYSEDEQREHYLATYAAFKKYAGIDGEPIEYKEELMDD